MTREEREREQARAHIWDSILFLSTALWLVWATRKNSFTVCHTRVPVQMMHIDLSRIIKACFPAYFQQTSCITFLSFLCTGRRNIDRRKCNCCCHLTMKSTRGDNVKNIRHHSKVPWVVEGSEARIFAPGPLASCSGESTSENSLQCSLSSSTSCP